MLSIYPSASFHFGHVSSREHSQLIGKTSSLNTFLIRGVSFFPIQPSGNLRTIQPTPLANLYSKPYSLCLLCFYIQLCACPGPMAPSLLPRALPLPVQIKPGSPPYTISPLSGSIKGHRVCTSRQYCLQGTQRSQSCWVTLKYSEHSQAL